MDHKDEGHEGGEGEQESVVVLDGGVEAEHAEHEHKQAEDDADDGARLRGVAADGSRQILAVDLALDDGAADEHDQTADEDDDIDHDQRVLDRFS